MLPSLGAVRLGQILFVIGCLTARAQDLVAPDDGSGVLTMLFQHKLWQTPNIHFNAANGDGWTTAPGIPMKKSTKSGKYAATEGWWEYSIQSSQLEFVFNDNNGIWDNNDNRNYRVNSAGTWAVTTKVNEPSRPVQPSYIPGPGYTVKEVKETGSFVKLQLQVNPSNAPEQFGADIKELTVEIYKLEDSVRVRIVDKNDKRWEVPKNLYPKGQLGKPWGAGSNGQQGQQQGQQGQQQGRARSNLEFTYTKNPFTFKVTRKSDGEVLFDSSKLDLVFKDQYLQVSTAVPADQSVYGIGESTRDSMRLSPGEKHTLWARDQGSFDKAANTYGSHPFFLGLNGKGKAHGVFLHNSNGMDVTLETDRLIYQILGGVLDFHIIAGPTPSDVVAQYTTLIGRPKLMPYWSYGFHQCRWGYSSVKMLQEVAANYTAAQIPLDVVWADIDYMDKFYDFTLDPVNFAQPEMEKFIAGLHKENRKFVPIIDPGIPDDPKDTAYTRGLELDVYIKDTEGKPYLGQVWPGPTVFPDFFHPNATMYWEEKLRRMHKNLEFDGIWIDMNELANFCPGTSCQRTAGVQCPNVGAIDKITTCCLACVDDKNKWNHPPFAINNGNNRDAIFNKGISTSALQYGGIRQYDSHNLYGFTEAIATNAIQERIFQKRSFVLSRSTFPGSGVHTAHWTGDNAARWSDLQWSVTTIQNFGLFGIPMVGADICGFADNSNEELCARWTALGAFYPFARNHNNLQSIPQETYVWENSKLAGRKFIGMRYRLLPYLYTLGYQAHVSGLPIARPLFMEFPNDANTHSGMAIERQYMLGNALLITPVVYRGATSISGYVPAGTWYNLFDYSRVDSAGQVFNWPVTILDMPVHIRAGSILPLHQPGAMTSADARKTPYDILIALPAGDAKATGQLYLDDGEDLSGVQKSTVVELRAETVTSTTTFSIKVGVNNYKDAKSQTISKIVALGVKEAPETIQVNGVAAEAKVVKHDASKQVLEIDLSSHKLSIADKLTVTWSSRAAASTS
ncbi:hypothetical protein P43SY_005707 [Pythium insidiosum]|uniref:alpha-glucosidase n=1 Tax=Pythium insidiosum TaxID=114742 RepID=A0AAD5QAT4_PYTIN|nr:hypothetical protein P43SY_005707 [Pythium insidiosum]